MCEQEKVEKPKLPAMVTPTQSWTDVEYPEARGLNDF